MPNWTFLTFGLPHSGKSSFGERLSEDFGFVHINIGAILRKKIKDGGVSPEADVIFNSVKNGVMLDPLRVNALITEELANHTNESVIFDGFPRYESAREDFYEFMCKFNRDEQAIVLLNFIIDTNQSAILQRQRNPNIIAVSIQNRAEQYFNEEMEVFKKMKQRHRYFDLYWEKGFQQNYQSVISALNF